MAVYISELNLIAITNDAGVYTFKKVPQQKFVMQFSALGYKLFISSVNFKDTLNEFNVNLHKSSYDLDEVVIYGVNNSDNEKTANNIAQLSANEMRESGALNLSDGIAKIPGISQLTTGAGISKPVIRGLFGNRIQTVLMGLRFDNQQWQDEHGLGLSDVGIDKVEIIKGPASLLYGSEAMGGVINIIEEKPAPQKTIRSDFATRMFSSTYGIATDVGVKGATEKINWRIRVGEESHADYNDGNGKRVLNSRFGGYYAKAGFGFKQKNWISQNNYMFTQSNFGFLMDIIQLQDPPDDRLSRDFSRPHHTVNLHVVSSQNTFFLQNSKLKLNFGVQSNNRQEQEGGNKVSLNMLLNSYILNGIWTKNIKNTELSFGTQDYYQTNANLGSRTIIPDAKQYESSLYSYFKSNFKHLVLEGGARYDIRHIETFATGLINTDPSTPGTKVLPFNRMYNSLNGSLGISWFNKYFNVKSNLSTGYRAANLAELSSNGLHEGTYRYEIGNPDMKIEQNLCGDILLGYRSENLSFNVSAYYNHFFNYIYLATDSLQYIGFLIYNYVQNDATIKGVESVLDIHPEKVSWFDWLTSYSYVLGTRDNGDYLPFIPAPKLNSDIKLSFEGNKKVSEFFVKPGVTYVFVQDRPAEFETATLDYGLLNAAAGITINNKRTSLQFSLSGNNLLNKVYYDHLSRFKYYGIYNIGTNISFNFKIMFH